MIEINRKRSILNSFDLKNVIILDERLMRQYTETRDFYMNLQDDSLLHGFRKRAGLAAPGVSLGGWYGGDYGNQFGQLLSAYTRMYVVNNDQEALDKAIRLMHEWSKTIEEDGFFFYNNNNSKVTHYTYDKLVTGLLDLYWYAGVKEALEYLKKITNWAVKYLDRSKPYAKSSFHSPGEWYTISESLYRAYFITEDIAYKELGDSLFYTEYFDNLMKKDFSQFMRAAEESSTRRYHAYSHVNTFNCAGMAYYITGDPKYLEILVEGYCMIKATQLYATGGYGPAETFMYPGQRSECLYSEANHFETSCGSWAAFKMAKYLIEFTGNATYGDWIEQLIYNGIGALLPVKPDGRVMYFSRYGVNGAHKDADFEWPCCAGTYPLNVTEYYNLIYFKSDDGIYVNLYLSSEVEWIKDETRIRISQETKFPLDNVSVFKILINEKKHFKICFRIPGWCKNKEISFLVNNKLAYAVIYNGWAIIEREWNNKDEIVVKLPVFLSVNPVESIQDYPVTLQYGPVVLVSKQDNKPNVTKNDIESFETLLVRTDKNSLHFSGYLENGERINFMPFYEVNEGENYYMHFDPVSEIIHYEHLKYGPDNDAWELLDFGYSSKGYKASFSADFTGTGIRWVGRQRENGATASVYIDDILVGMADQYGPFGLVPWMWEYKGLSDGKHTIRVEVENEKTIDTKWRTVTKGSSINVIHLSILK